VDEVEAVFFERPGHFHVVDFEFAVRWYPGQSALSWSMASYSTARGTEPGAQATYHCGWIGAISIPIT
jgi:hypothetical protein